MTKPFAALWDQVSVLETLLHEEAVVDWAASVVMQLLPMVASKQPPETPSQCLPQHDCWRDQEKGLRLTDCTNLQGRCAETCGFIELRP